MKIKCENRRIILIFTHLIVGLISKYPLTYDISENEMIHKKLDKNCKNVPFNIIIHR